MAKSMFARKMEPPLHYSGRPKGVRNRFNLEIYEAVLTFAFHPIAEPPPEKYAGTEIWGAMRLAQRQGSFLKEVIKMLDRNFTHEHNSAAGLSEEELSGMIEDFRARLAAIAEGAARKSIDVTPQKALVDARQ
jgi:hypothetical protein